MELVIYDEIERFPSFKDKLFNYPFTNRKNIPWSWTVDNVTLVKEDYTYFN